MGAAVGAGMVVFDQRSQITAATSITLNGAHAAGATNLTVVSTTGLVVGDVLSFVDTGGSAITRTEFGMVANPSTSTNVVLKRPLAKAHNTTDLAFSKADLMQWKLDGGSLYSIIFDYSAQTTGDNIIIAAYGQPFTSMSFT